jgi:hypothetical protein
MNFNLKTNLVLDQEEAYNIAAWYTNEEFGKHFVDYLGPTMFNSLSLNVKKCIYNIVNKAQGYLCNKIIVFAYLLELKQKKKQHLRSVQTESGLSARPGRRFADSQTECGQV